ncbi:MAG TPA: GGDEF domain-containing protein, partial [Syntrophaceticus sp.]|nr:GGDEF domain-containing protein [Syntrophaceticus sp.]
SILLAKILGIKVTLNDSNSITCSIGIAYHIPDTFFNLKNLFWKADKALLQAKKTGKNRIFVNTEQGLVEP